MSLFANRVRISTATTGTGTVNLGGAYSSSFVSPVEAGMVSGQTYTYVLEEGNDFEIGRGVYTSGSPGTLTRATVLLSKIGGTAGTTKLTLAGVASVRITIAAEDFLPLTRFSSGGSIAMRTITGATSITIADYGKTVLFNSASDITVTIGAAATLGDGFFCRIKNIGAGVITLDPNSSETIDGATTKLILPKQSGEMHGTGTAFQTVGLASRVVLSTQIISAGAGSVVVPLFKGWTRQQLILRRIHGASAANLIAQVSNDNASSYLGAGQYYFDLMTPGSAAKTYASTNGGNFAVLANNLGTTDSNALSGFIDLIEPAVGVRLRYISQIMENEATAGRYGLAVGAGLVAAAGPFTHMAFLMSSSVTISGGEIDLIGLE